ncbi:hypothetical protein F0562_025652 [Nyssa sinensis]|uniref:Uncharacterized protein n=1 Tax=Nyssa sinensis TaxID=561372 RepID=A0A5J5B930_9ASTE|nr:hypothetical protein F0562_025652 [Nyssa sinensis]
MCQRRSSIVRLEIDLIRIYKVWGPHMGPMPLFYKTNFQNDQVSVAGADQHQPQMASLLLLQPLSTLSSSSTLLFLQNPHHFTSSLKSSHHNKPLTFKSLRISFALTESDSPKFLNPNPEPNPQILLQELADSFVLPADFFSQLPRDLRLDLNDAAFDLSNGPVIDECGQELGETLLNISRAWELAETSTCTTLVSKLPSLVGSLTNNAKSAFGKRLVSAGRRFQSMGQYGQGELQRIAKAMIMTGKVLTENPVSPATDEEPKQETRMLKFGELQVELTPEKAYIGAAIGFIFGILSWELSQGVQSIPESSLQYANGNALLLAKLSLPWGLFYSEDNLTRKKSEVVGAILASVLLVNAICV